MCKSLSPSAGSENMFQMISFHKEFRITTKVLKLMLSLHLRLKFVL